MIAPMSSANTIAKPALDPTCRMSSTGQQRDDPVGHRAARLQHAEEIEQAGPHHRQLRRQRVGVDHRRHRVGGVVKPVDELEAERDEQRHAEQHEGQRSCVVCAPVSLTST